MISGDNIEKYKLYYFTRSYWRKRLRKCYLCKSRASKENQVNFGIAFDKDRKLFHRNCLVEYMNDTPRG